MLRIAIPIGIAIVLGVIAFAMWFNPLRMLSNLPIDPGKLVLSGTKITMEQPRLAGYTRDSRAYELTARAAAQDLAKPDLLELKDIRARVEMQDKATIEMTAANGIYDTKADVVRLGENIILSSSSGYQGRLSEAVIDVKKGNIVSDRPVEVKMLNGTLNANRLEVVDNGDLVRFEGGIVMTLMLETQSEQRAETP
ncbi:MAG TPA: LPS export ABC transporter periplasmic protein LptC [Xanthobacteraceae bacterium]|nr:LPS export ABC transporter periplasmic protein LptC [Xanthobacteraceae bacterium]